MALSTGVRLGPYEIQSAIGAGGMGEVYKARDTRLDRTVAIKVLPESFATDPEFRTRFNNEARAISTLDHPHICALFDVGEHDGTAYLVMQYLEGETLAQRLEKGALPLDQALRCAIEMTDALDKAHRKGIVHRDLKPGNIMLTRTGAKLLDFGLAKASKPVVAAAGLSMLPTTPPNLTARGAILGTFQYMAPEQLEGKDADARTDIFAFGAVIYEMLTGRKAFEGKSQASLIGAIMHSEPPPMSSLQPAMPPALDRVVRTCLAKEPDERWQAAGDLCRELKWVAEGGSQIARLPTIPGRANRALGWRPLVVISGASLFAALIATATWSLKPAPSPLPEPVVTRLDVVTPPTSDAFSFALSHDGRQLAFVANGEKGPQLWLRPLDHVSAQPLAGTEGAAYPFWAPDGRAIGFFADGKLKRINPIGATVQVLADASLGRGGTWNPDGVIVFAPTGSDALMRVAATGGTAEPVTRLAAGQGSHRWPQFLPDGRRFLFLMAVGQPQTQGTYVGSVDGGEPTRVMPAETAGVYAAPGHLLLVSQGVLNAYPFDGARATVAGEAMPVAQAVGTNDGLFHSAFSVSAAGVLAHRPGAGSRRQLAWVDRTGKMVGAIGPPDENALANPELAPDGQRLAVTRTVQGNNDVWFIETSRGVASRFTFDVALDSGALWSPDGSQVVFRSTRNGVFDLFEKPASGAADEQPLFATSQAKSPLDWSRDGRFLLYSTQDPKTATDLWALPLMGERKPPSFGPNLAPPNSGEPRRSLGVGGPFAVLQSSFDETQGQLSPDGRWLAYASNESGRYEIYIRTFPDAGGKWQVSAAGGVQPRWRRDGRELYYVSPDTQLVAVPIRLASETHTLEAGAPVALFPTRLAVGGNIVGTGFLSRAQYAVAPDGRFLMNMAADDAVTSPITIVQNWHAVLKK